MCDLPPPAPSCGRQPCAGPRAAVTADSLLMSTICSRSSSQKKTGSSLRRARICSEAPAALRRGCGAGRPGGRGPRSRGLPAAAAGGRRPCAGRPSGLRTAALRPRPSAPAASLALDTRLLLPRQRVFFPVFEPVPRSSSFAGITGTVRFILCTY